MSKQRNMLDDGTVVAKVWEPGKDGNCRCQVGKKCTDCERCKGDDALQPMSPGEYTYYSEEEEQQTSNVLKSTGYGTLAQRKALAKELADKRKADEADKKGVRPVLPEGTRFAGVLSPGQATFAASLKLPKE